MSKLYRGIFCLKVANTDSKMVEIYALNPNDNFQTLSLIAVTALSESDAVNFDFAFAIGTNGAFDLFCMKKSNTTNGFLEVHILNGADNYQTFFLHAETPLALGAPGDFVFRLAQHKNFSKYDVFCLKKNHTDSPFFEVHVLDGAKNFQEYVLHSTTILAQQDAASNFDFQVADYNADGTADIFCLKTPPGGQFEVHVLDGRKHYQDYTLHTETPITAADAATNFTFGVADYDTDYFPDVIGFKTTNTPGMFEIHILSSESKYHKFCYQAPTGITEQDASQFVFLPFPDAIPFYVYPGVN